METEGKSECGCGGKSAQLPTVTRSAWPFAGLDEARINQPLSADMQAAFDAALRDVESGGGAVKTATTLSDATIDLPGGENMGGAGVRHLF